MAVFISLLLTWHTFLHAVVILLFHVDGASVVVSRSLFTFLFVVLIRYLLCYVGVLVDDSRSHLLRTWGVAQLRLYWFFLHVFTCHNLSLGRRDVLELMYFYILSHGSLQLNSKGSLGVAQAKRRATGEFIS